MLLKFLILIFATSVLSCDQNDCVQPAETGSFPLTNETIDEYCRNYEKYKTCMNLWANRCVDGDKINSFHETLNKAMKFYTNLCSSESFKTEYLREIVSLEKISEDRTKCFKSFTNDMLETQKDPYREDSIFKVCCSLKAYQDCTEPLCDSKCTDSGKRLYKNIFEMLLEGTESMHCDKLPYAEHCKSGVFKNSLNSLVLYFTIICSILNLTYKSIVVD